MQRRARFRVGLGGHARDERLAIRREEELKLITEELDDVHTRLDGQMPVRPHVRHVVDVLGPDPQDHILTHGFRGLPGERRFEEPGVRDGVARRSGDLRREEVHGGRADESRDEQVGRALVKIFGCIQLL